MATVSSAAPGPRLFGVRATAAPVVVVLRRGPSDWVSVARWDVGETIGYQTGAWLRGRIYPQRCDVSPDGRYLSWFALDTGARWALGPTYVGVSRVPWLHAIAAWGTDGAWTRGLHFLPAEVPGDVSDPPDHGSLAGLPWTLAHTRAATFAVERRTGWTETPDSPPRRPEDVWDERRAETVAMERTSPAGGGARLRVQGGFAAFRTMDRRVYGGPSYRVVGSDGSSHVLRDVQWADWAPDGRLLTATTDGRLQVRHGATVVWEHDVASDLPMPRAAPEDAHRW